jgi:hypothetical protein
VEKFRDELSSKAQEEYKKLFLALTNTLKTEEKMAILDEMENLMPAWSYQVAYYKGWIFASKENFDSALPLFSQSLKTAHLSMKDFLNFEHKESSYEVKQVLSNVKFLNVLVHPQFQEFIGNYFGETAKLELQAMPEVQRIEKLKQIGILLVAEDDLRVSPQFAALGDMYKAAGLIWSGVAPNKMDQRDAESFCRSLGRGSRLPTKEEFEALSRVMSLGGTYTPDLFPGTIGHLFWSSSVDSRYADSAFYFNGNGGNLVSYRRNDYDFVRCVRF